MPDTLDRMNLNLAPPMLRQPPIGKVGRPKANRKAPMGLSTKVKAAIDLMIVQGMKRPDAAKSVGLADSSLYLALRNPEVLRYWNDQLEVLRTSERPRSIHKIAKLRDDADSERVQLEAAKYLDGGDRHGGVQVNVNVANISPGYQIAIPDQHAAGASQLMKLAGSTRNVLDQRQSVPTDDADT